MMNIKYWVLVSILILSVVFLTFDKCGSSTKLDQLRGEYKKASEIAEVEKRIKEETIKEQEEKIVVLNTTIEVLNTTIEARDEDLAGLDNKVTDLEGEFGNLIDKDAKIDNLTKQVEAWKEKFSISRSIIKDKDEIIFSLTVQYQSQLVISNEYKSMYESARGLIDIRTKQIKEFKEINRQLKLTGKLKTGIVVTMAGVVLYSLLRK